SKEVRIMHRKLAVLFSVLVFFSPIAFGRQPGPQGFPLLGIGLTQTLRLTAVARPPSPNFAATGCIAQLGFADIQGNQVPAVQKIVNLLPGQSDFLDFPASSSLTTLGQRIELRPLAETTPDPATGMGADCAFFAEIFDPASGFSRVYRQPGPTGVPGDVLTFPLMGIALGQVLRLSAVTRDPGPQQSPTGETITPGPCMVTLDFVDANGVRVGRDPGPSQLTLNPGQGGSLDLPAAGMVLLLSQRALVRPVVQVDSVPGAANQCIGVDASAEIFLRLTGATWSMCGPGPGSIPAVQ
ncbi:MAG: hypothetical protein ACM3NO_07655, partial [Deltaproteobacteria bacterium]